MSEPIDREAEDRAYREYARKMDLIENGPTTTNFQQLLDKGVALPEPDHVPDDKMRAKVWEILGGLAGLGVYLDDTDHLNDRELYVKLWHDVLREEVPAFDEFGCNQVMMLQADGVEPDTSTYFRYYADERWRREHQEENPDYPMPPHEDPPYNRDCLLPIAPGLGWAEASSWLAANWRPSPLALQRFSDTKAAIDFVDQLYAAGAESVAIDNVTMPPDHDWAPYADTLLVALPDNQTTRQTIFDVVHNTGRPDEVSDLKKPYMVTGPDLIRLRWNSDYEGRAAAV